MSRPEKNPSPEGETTSKAEILYLQGEVPTPPDMLEYFLQARFGRISNQPEVIPALTVSPFCSDTEGVLVFSRRGAHLKQHWLSLIAQIAEKETLTGKQKWILGRIATYIDICRGQKDHPLKTLAKTGASPYLYQKLVAVSMRHLGQPIEALRAADQIFNFFMTNDLDPFDFRRGVLDNDERKIIHDLIDTHLQKIEHEISLFRRLAETGPTISFVIPVLHREEPHQAITTGETRVDEWLTLERPLGRLRILEGERVSLAIVGPANSGKSTLTASLVVAVNKLINEARSHVDLTDLRLGCDFMDLDRQRPDVAEILSGSGSSERSKTHWTPALAMATAKEFIGRQGNIIIGDAPGGSPDKITEIVVGPADLTILLILAENDESWEKQRQQWQAGLRQIGQTPVVLLRSRKPGETSPITGERLESTTTSFRWAEGEFFKPHYWISRVGGRVVGLARKVREDDYCISTLAKILLFDLLPQAVIARKKQTRLTLARLRNEQELSPAYYPGL